VAQVVIGDVVRVQLLSHRAAQLTLETSALPRRVRYLAPLVRGDVLAVKGALSHAA